MRQTPYFKHHFTMLKWTILLCVVLNLKTCTSLTLLEFMIGPKVGSRARNVASDSDLEKGVRLIRQNGYPGEMHKVTTEDGYILVLHRVPYSRKNSSLYNRPPVIFLHGLFATSDGWLFRSPKELPYILADAGYDVWTTNYRGNYYSRRHTTLNPDKDISYWNFTIHEVGFYDLPATVDYILNLTNQDKVYLIGHSLGGTVGCIFLASRPEYVSKVRMFVNYAPQVYTRHHNQPMLESSLTLFPWLQGIVAEQNIYELLPRNSLLARIVTRLCFANPLIQEACGEMISYGLGGYYTMLFVNNTFPEAFKYYPSGTSLGVVLHIGQLVLSGKLKPYNSQEEYDVSRITVPVSIHYSDGDVLVTSEDVKELARRLPNVVNVDRITDKSFQHGDFYWPSNYGKSLLYSRTAEIMDKYR